MSGQVVLLIRGVAAFRAAELFRVRMSQHMRVERTFPIGCVVTIWTVEFLRV